METKFKHNKVRMTEKRKLAMLAVMYHAKALRIHDTAWTIRVNFIKGFSKVSKIMANCGPDGHMFINLNIDADLPGFVMQNTLAHEMVHAKQFIKGELTSNEKCMKWNGKKVSAKLAYHQTPWEIEAMSSEVIMAHNFMHFWNNLKK
jgi:hypothetical protein